MKQDKRDRLEQYVLDNREGFDHLEPNPQVLERIRKDLEGDSQKSVGFSINFNYMWRAAAVILLGVSAYLVIERQQLIADKEPVATVEDINPEFYEAEGYFVQMISEKRDLIMRYQEEYPDLIEDFDSDIQKLDEMYLQLKEELKTENTEQVVDALIQNLQLRIDILNQQLVILENIRKAQNNEDVTI